MDFSEVLSENEAKLNNFNDYLILKDAHGINTDLKQAIHFLNDETFVYFVGCNLSITNIKTKNKKLHCLKLKEHVELLHFSPNKQFLIIVEIDKKFSNIYLYDLIEACENKKLKKSITIENEIISGVSISLNMELMACYTNSPNWNLSIYNLNKLKLLANTKIITNITNGEQNVQKIDFFPCDNKRLLVLGHNLIKIYIYNETSIKLIYNLDCHVFLENFSWLTKNELISFDKYGNLYAIEPKQNSLKKINLNNYLASEKNDEMSKLSINPNQSEKISLQSNEYFLKLQKKSSMFINYQMSNVKWIICVQRGFFLLHMNSDSVFYYRVQEKQIFTYVISFVINLKKIKNYQHDKMFKEVIINMSINENHTYLLVLSNCKKIYIYELKDLLNNYNNTTRQSDEFELLLDSFHYDNVTGMDYCINKPIIATSSVDRALIVYNYDTNSIELKQYFEDDLLGVALHPSGLYLILSTTKCLKYMCLYLDCFKVMHVLNVKSCTTCIYSNNGNCFAFVHGTVIQIYSSLKLTEIHAIKTHEMGKIKQLCFSRDDHYLICCSMAGIVKIWNTSTLSTICEITTKGLSYIGLTMHPSKEWLFLISTERSIRQIQFQLSAEFKSSIKPNGEFKLSKLDTRSDENITCLQINRSGKIICVGTNKGSIRIYLIPDGVFKDYKAHSSSITKLCFTFNDEYLVTSSEDGTIIYWKINEKIKSIEINHQFNEEVLIDKNSYYKTLNVIKNNQNKINDCRIETDFLYNFKELYSTIKKRELSNRLNKQMLELKEKIDNVSIEREDDTEKYDENLRVLKKDQLDKIQKLDFFYGEKISLENVKNQDLVKDIINLEEQIKLNENKLSYNQTNNEKVQFERVENQLILAQEKFQKKFSLYDEQINSVIDYEFEFKEEINLEIFRLNEDFHKNFSDLKTINNDLNREANILQNDIRFLESSINDLNKGSASSKIRMKNLEDSTKELDLLEQKLKLELESKESCLIEIQKNLKIVNYECEKLENEDSEFENKLEKEFKTLNLEKENYLTIKKEIEKEIKQKGFELIILKSKVNSLGFRRRKTCPGKLQNE